MLLISHSAIQQISILLIFFLSNAYRGVFRQPAGSCRRCHTAFDDRWGTSHGMRVVKSGTKGSQVFDSPSTRTSLGADMTTLVRRDLRHGQGPAQGEAVGGG